MDLLVLVARNYIRWRHGLVGSADKSVVDDNACTLTDAAGIDVTTLDDAAIMALFTAPVVKQDVMTIEDAPDRPVSRRRSKE